MHRPKAGHFVLQKFIDLREIGIAQRVDVSIGVSTAIAINRIYRNPYGIVPVGRPQRVEFDADSDKDEDQEQNGYSNCFKKTNDTTESGTASTAQPQTPVAKE